MENLRTVTLSGAFWDRLRLLEEIHDFWTLITDLPNGMKQAGIILPASMENKYSPSKCHVYSDGFFSCYKSTCFFKPYSLMEWSDKGYRKKAHHNRSVMRNCTSFIKSEENKPTEDTTLAKKLEDWIDAVFARGDIQVVRFFIGGDAFVSPYMDTPSVLSFVIENAYRYPDKHFIMRTANVSMCNSVLEDRRAPVPDNVYLITESQAYEDLLLYRHYTVMYQWDHQREDGEPYLTDLDVFPDVNLRGDKNMFFKGEYLVTLPPEVYTFWYNINGSSKDRAL